jgi:hypothetical protein
LVFCPGTALGLNPRLSVDACSCMLLLSRLTLSARLLGILVTAIHAVSLSSLHVDQLQSRQSCEHFWPVGPSFSGPPECRLWLKKSWPEYALSCLVVNDVERKDGLQAVSLTGLRRVRSKGLQTLANSIRHELGFFRLLLLLARPKQNSLSRSLR